MSFSELRRRAIRNSTLNVERFAEVATYEEKGMTAIDLTVKVESETKLAGNAERPGGRRQVDGEERVRVVISHDAAFTGGFLPDTPRVGALLTRSEEVDSDVRPWIFSGETIYRTPYSGTYIFTRTRRTFDARR